MLYTENATVVSNVSVNGNCYKMKLFAPNIAKNAKPGQFVEVACGELQTAPLLKRPISIHNVYDEIVEIIYFVVGKGTDLLSKKQTGNSVETVGPLGNGFSAENTENHILVGGGYGVPPMYYLAKEMVKTINPKNIFVCIGAKTENLVLCYRDFISLGINVCVATDDGSLGLKGFVTDSVKKILENNRQSACVYACGPGIMEKNLYKLTENYDFVKNCQCSMENVMACGIGVCNGCVIKIRQGDGWTYKRVCKDGPVFRGAEIIW